MIFISNGYGGRASDVHITEDCGILKKLLPGDAVLTDRIHCRRYSELLNGRVQGFLSLSFFKHILTESFLDNCLN